jgi:hypothetical protein
MAICTFPQEEYGETTLLNAYNAGLKEFAAGRSDGGRSAPAETGRLRLKKQGPA